MREFASQASDREKTPTLRQFLKESEGVYPQVSPVRIIFKPSKYAQFSLITDHGFRVSVPKSSPVFGVLETQIDEFIAGDVCVGVRVDNPEKCSWTLVHLETESADWAHFDWGYKIEIGAKKKPSGKNPQRSK